MEGQILFWRWANLEFGISNTERQSLEKYYDLCIVSFSSSPPLFLFVCLFCFLLFATYTKISSYYTNVGCSL